MEPWGVSYNGKDLPMESREVSHNGKDLPMESREVSHNGKDLPMESREVSHNGKDLPMDSNTKAKYFIFALYEFRLYDTPLRSVVFTDKSDGKQLQ